MLCMVFFVFGVFFATAYAAPDCTKPPIKLDFMHCCRMPDIIEEHINKCSEKFPSNELTSFCHDECVFDEIGLFDHGKKIQPAKVQLVIASLFKGNNDFINIANAAYKLCDGLSKTQVAKMVEKHPEEAAKCHPLPAFLAHCFLTETFLKCPSSMWDTDRGCNGAKEYLQKCIIDPENKV